MTATPRYTTTDLWRRLGVRASYWRRKAASTWAGYPRSVIASPAVAPEPERIAPLRSLPLDLTSGALVGGLLGSLLVMLNAPLAAFPTIVGGSLVMGGLGVVHWWQGLRITETPAPNGSPTPGSHLTPQRRQNLSQRTLP